MNKFFDNFERSDQKDDDDDDENRNNNIYQFIYLFIFLNKTSMKQKNNFMKRAGARGDSRLARVLTAIVMMFTLAVSGA